MKIDDTENKMSKLVNIICYENEVSDEDKALCVEASINIHTMESVIFKGREAVKNGTASIKEPNCDDIYMFSYTSGTTGDPKGVKLSHKMVMTSAAAVNDRSKFTSDDSYISYLPAAHVFE